MMKMLLILLMVVMGAKGMIMKLERSPNWPVGLERMKAHDRARHSRLYANFSLGGSVDYYGIYFTRIRLGNPPKDFYVSIDTGSDLLWVACDPCYDCASKGRLFKLHYFDPHSSSASSLPCTDEWCVQSDLMQCPASGDPNCSYKAPYEDDSKSSGYIVSSTLHLDMIASMKTRSKSSTAKILFGCATSLHGFSNNFGARLVDGMLGLGKADISVISQLSSAGVSPKIFTHCLKGSGGGGGFLVLGEAVVPGLVYTPLVPFQPNYNVELQSVDVNGRRVDVDSSVFSTSSSRGTIVDSGSTLAHLPEAAFHPFVTAIAHAVSPSLMGGDFSEENPCFLTGDSDAFPSVTLNFAGGARMILKPDNYLVNDDRGDYYHPNLCIGWQKMEGLTVLGDIVLKDKVVVYDLVQQRIGWIDHDCDAAVNLTSPRLVKASSHGVHHPFPPAAILVLLVLFIIKT